MMKRTKFYLILIFIVTFSLTLFNACEDTITGAELDAVEIPSENVSFSQYIQPVLDKKCANSGCHNTQDMAAGLNFTSWAGTTADPNIVFPRDPDNSILIWAIERRAGTPEMPPLGYAALTDNQIEGIRTWIREGAQAN